MLANRISQQPRGANKRANGGNMGIRGVWFRGVTNESIKITQQTHMVSLLLSQSKLVKEVMQ
jgi:hypothetical protein